MATQPAVAPDRAIARTTREPHLHGGWFCGDGELVVTRALATEDENTGRIVRMSVKQTHRRKGIGRALVTHLLNVGCQKGFTQVRVSTEHDWEEAIGLYEHCGFSECSRDDVNIYFSLALET